MRSLLPAGTITGAAALSIALAAGGLARADFQALRGTPGADMVVLGGHAASVALGAGDDHVSGSPEADEIAGNRGADTLDGMGGEDSLYGGRGADSLSGAAGDDLLQGDRGDDTLNGGPGADRFVLAAGGGHDHVTDFSASDGDLVEVRSGDRTTIRQQGADAVVGLADGSELRLRGVSAAGLEHRIYSADRQVGFGPGAAVRARQTPYLPLLVVLLLAGAAAAVTALARRRH
jgi:Ca2+-binding RTX toxin-like protein